MEKDTKKGGSNADGSRNPMYCSFCYANGKLTHPNMTLLEIRAIMKKKLKELGYPGIIAGFFTHGIPKLQRWRK